MKTIFIAFQLACLTLLGLLPPLQAESEGSSKTANWAAFSNFAPSSSSSSTLGNSKITGTVTGPDGITPLRGIGVIAYRPNGIGGWNEVGSTSTQIDGSYSLSSLSEGNYRIKFSQWFWPSYFTEFYNDAQEVESAIDIVVGENMTVSGINASLRELGKITGKVTGPDGVTPLIRNAVVAYRLDGFGGWESVSNAYTNLDGEYILTGLKPGTYRIAFSYSEDGTYSYEYYNNVPRIESAQDILIGDGNTVSGINASLQELGKIAGVVTAADGITPLSGISVTVHQLVSAESWAWVSGAVTQSDGTYMIQRLVAGDYRIKFTGDKNFKEQFYNDAPDIRLAKDVTVKLATTTGGINASLIEYGKIVGVVTGLDGVTPLSGISVGAYRSNGSGGWADEAFSSTGENGSYTLTGLKEGSYKVRFFQVGLKEYVGEYYNDAQNSDSAVDVVVKNNTTTNGINVSMMRASSISGYVTGKDGGKKLLGILVEAYQFKSGVGWEYFTNTATFSNGFYNLSGLAPGSYRIKFSDESYYDQYYPNTPTIDSAIDIVVGEDVNVYSFNCSMVGSGKITGKVTGPDGLLPLKSIKVIAYHYNKAGIWEANQQTETLVDGSYRLDGLVIGYYRLKFEDSMIGSYSSEYYDNVTDKELARMILVTKAETVSGIDTSLVEAGKIIGKVTDLNGVTPLNEIQVSVYGLDSTGSWQIRREVYTQADGSYKAQGLTAGNYRIRFSDPRNKVYPDRYYDSATSLLSAKDIVVATNATVSEINSTMGDPPPIPPVLTAPQIEVMENGKALAQSSLIRFKVTKVKTAAVAKYFTIRNAGGTALKGIQISKMGAHSANFAIGKLSVTSLAPGGSATFKVTFKPSAAGNRNASILISSNDPSKNPFVIRLTGKGKASKAKSAQMASSATSFLTEFRSGTLADRTMAGTDLTDGLKYNTLTFFKSTLGQTTPRTVEVSSDLMDWFSGSTHTTVVTENENYLKVRDNTPISKNLKRYIRAKKTIR
jgi:5-hydroxyisourate hydrolase-like protein (transthyretin family)